MAKRKTTTKKMKRRKSSLSAGTRKRRSKKKSGFLSEGNPIAPANLIANGKRTIAAGLGGGAAILTNKIPVGKFGKVMIALIGGFGMNSFGLHALGNGFTGGQVALAFSAPSTPMNEDANFADENSLSDKPLFLDEEGNAMVLEEDLNDGTSYYRYLSGEELQEIEEAQVLEEN